MNTNNIKKYAPQARREFIDAVGKRLNQFGVYNKGKILTISEPTFSGTVMQIDGNSFDAGLAQARKRLTLRAEQRGFEPLVEQVAYTWFNRLCAIRFMELKGDYLEHGLRVLSHPEKANGFEILDHAQDVAEQLNLDRNHIVELKLAGNKDEELYRHLLLGQCHQLHQSMPFLFEALDDETELLLPDNLIRTDSILRGLVDSIPDDDWQQVEIIGWLYQFYISEKKDQVIGSVVKSEDIPAATQLFTPNWIVKYLVQNSVGRQWLMTYPDSGLKVQMEYYIESAEQEPSVIEALAAITPTSIDPETIKVLDPACGSGHILVEAYDILKAIYEERGYRVRDIPKLVLEKNLYGLDIDDRAAQLAGFALLMKARADDRRIFSRDIKLNVLAIQSTQNLDLSDLWRKLALNQDAKRGSMEPIFDDVQSNLVDTVDDIEFKQLRSILALFEQAKILGSLIQVPHEQAEYLWNLTGQLQELAEQGDTMQKPAAMTLLPYVQQAWLLAQQYDAVVANPPYMGSGYFNADFKNEIKNQYKTSRTDLYALFIERNIDFLKSNTSLIAMITRQDWMFTSSYSDIRNKLAHECMLHQLVHLGSGAFPSISGEVVQAAMYTYSRTHIKKYLQTYIDCSLAKENKEGELFKLKNKYVRSSDFFPQSVGSPILYQLSPSELKAFSIEKCFDDKAVLREGIHTGNNEKYVKSWWEVDFNEISFSSDSIISFDNSFKKYAPYNKGGTTTRWYENTEYVLAFNSITRHEMQQIKGHVRPSQSLYFKTGGTWSDVATKGFGVRYYEEGHLFDGAGPIISSAKLFSDIGIMNSLPFRVLSGYVMPNLHFKCGTVKKMPYPLLDVDQLEFIEKSCKEVIFLCKKFLQTKEAYWIFNKNTLTSSCEKSVAESFASYEKNKLEAINSIVKNEQDINEVVSKGYGLDINSYNEYLDINSVISKHSGNEIIELISYSLGCMMGRYSLDEPGLIYAHAGNVDFDPSRYQTFPVDEDGILPLTDQEWFKDDATNRFREFLVAVWGEDTLQQNLEFVAESLTLSSFKPKKGETNLDTVRRYLSNQFYKDHLQTYKKRPIYWLFSSGKQKAFECLVYLHRYNESTLARMRTEYVTPLLGKYDAFAGQLNKKIEDASTSEAVQLKKELAALEKKQSELREFDDKLKHYADMRIKLDLDDGVKVNYGKVGDLLAEVKAITGGKE
jgi:type II restriction/modification system DNA methylase subunit YeeA